jgi:DNA-binding XRE family transcriptional regulator/quercetin dioxygenase-like cupin family protein
MSATAPPPAGGTTAEARADVRAEVRAEVRAAAAWVPVVESIGPKVRALRQERGLSLQQLAHAADVSAAAVHKVERGDMVPTITTLLKIAGALHTPIGHFVEDAPAGEPLAVHRRGVESTPVTAGSATLGGPAARFRSTGSVTRLPAGGHGKGQRRQGETLVVVLHGSLTVTVADESYLVTAGESLHMPTHVEHTWTNPGPDIAQAIWFSVPTS